MAINPPPVKTRRTCIFCGASGMTKEHIWPEWLQEIFPNDAATTHTYGTIDPSPIIGLPKIIEKQRPGHSGKNTVKVVCRTCNNEWLSRLEEKTKPVLTSLALGEKLNLTPTVQKSLAVWLAKTAMTAERVRPRANGITQEERTFLMTHLLPPPNWIIWVVAYAGGAWSELGMGQHRGDIANTPIPRPDRGAKYIQATTLGLGYTVFLIVSTTWEEAPKAFAQFDGNGLFQIWPAQPRSILWPPTNVFTDPEIDKLATILSQSGVLNQSFNPLANWTFKM